MMGPWEKYQQPNDPYAITQPQTPTQQLNNDATRQQMVRTGQQIQSNDLNNANTQTNIQQGQEGVKNAQFNRSQGLRQEFNGLPQVKSYADAMQALGGALQAPDTPQGDLSIVYAYAKAMDPGSVVREGEMDMANSTASLAQRIQQQFGMLGTGKRLPPEVRTGLIETMRQRVAAMRPAYDQQIARYGELAKQNGYDPTEVVGQPVYDAYRPLEENYIRAHGGTPRDPNSAAPPLRTQTEGGFGLEQPKEMPGANDYRNALYGAMKSKQIKSYEDVIAFTNQFNQAHGTQIPPPVKDKGFFNAVAASLKGKDFNVALPRYDQRTLQKVQEMERNAGRGTAAKAGVKDAVTVGLGDEIQGAVNAAGQSLRGEGSFSDLYGVNRDAARIYQDFQQQTHPGFYMAGQLAGSAALPAFGASTPAELARLGAAYGGAYGFDSGQGGFGDRLASGIEGAAAGAATGYAVPKGLELAGNLLQRAPRLGITSESERALMRQQQIEAAQGAQDLGIQMPRFVAGGPTAQKLGAIADQSPFGAPALRRGARTMLDQAEAARNKRASSIGNILEPESMGDTAIAGAKATNRANRDAAGRLYTRADELNGGQRYPLPRAAAALDQQIAELSDTPGGMTPAILDTFKDVRAKLDGEWSPEGIQRMRSALSKRFVEAGMNAGDASRRSKMVVDAAEADIMTGMRAAGKDNAAAALKQASTKWAENERLKEQVFQPILGINKEKTGAEVARGLTAAFKNNPARARKFMANLPEDQANDVRASVIAQMGNPGSGGQDLKGEAFSLATFLTHWNDVKYVRDGVFDPSTVKALNKLAAVAERAKAAGHVENHSNTGSINITALTASPLVAVPGALASGKLGEAALAVLSTVGLALSQHWGATLLASPKFAQKLAQMPMNPKAARQFWGGQWVQRLAATNPEIRQPLIEFQRRMIANDNFVPSLSANPNQEQDQQQPY